MRRGAGLSLGIATLIVLPAPAGAVTETFTFVAPGGPQTWTVPDGITEAVFVLYGAQGGASGANLGGKGGSTVARLELVPGETIELNVGGTGSTCIAPPISACWIAGGFNGGGQATHAALASPEVSGGSGGGASDIRICATPGSCGFDDRVLVAGGGGGASRECSAGGVGGGETGGDGCGANFGRGATQIAGGLGSAPELVPPELTNGVLGTGGAGSGGGGGGGLWGGGGGGAGQPQDIAGGGGGGSGYCDADPPVLWCQTIGGWQSGDGLIRIVYALDGGSAPPQDAPEAPPGRCHGSEATITGTSGNDVLIGTSGPDVIVGGPGDDTIRALGGDDLICAGPGQDTVHAGPGADTLRGGGGDDDLRGRRGNDVLVGRGGDDRLGGGPGIDGCRGGKGDDLKSACE